MSLVFLLLICLTEGTNITSTTIKPDRRIVGGYSCKIEAVPYVVSLRYAFGMRHFCGGSLITRDWVLTAAHCVEGFAETPKSVMVAAGTDRADYVIFVQTIPARSVFAHPQYQDSVKKNDVGLVHTRQMFYLSPKIQLVRLPRGPLEEQELVTACERALISGWGTQQIRQPAKHRGKLVYNPQLQCAVLGAITDDKCEQFMPVYFLMSKMLCAMKGNTSADACQGDSGGPFVCDKVQYGITCCGKGCGLKLPAFYTRVDQFLPFIWNTVANLGRRRSTDGLFVCLTIIVAVAIKS